MVYPSAPLNQSSMDSADKQDQAPMHHDSPTESNSKHFIDWDGQFDPSHPQNWSLKKKSWATFILSLLNLVFTIDSSIFGSGDQMIAQEFDVSSEVTILGITLFLLGFVVGPPFWGPLSEKFGRRIPLVIGVGVASIFAIMVAAGQNLATLLIGRFISGSFGVAPVAILGGSLTDTWNAVDRGVALAASMACIFSGPLLGPIIGGFVVTSNLGWRWNMWLMAIFGGFSSVLTFVTLPETYPPVLLTHKAARLRKKTGDPEYFCEHDRESKSIGYIVRVYLVRPWSLFFTEPILVLITLYQSFIFGLLYLFSQSYSIAFEEVRGWPHQFGSMPLLALIIGVGIGLVIIIVYTKKRFARHVASNNGIVVPELRLPMMVFGGCILPVGLFWFAWTSNPVIPWPAMTVAGILIGCGIYIIFVQCFGYIIDVYPTMANSAIASNTFVRSLFGAGFPLFAPAMYHNLGIAWASSLLAFLSIAMVPMPVVFYLYGGKMREWSKSASNAGPVDEKNT